MKENRFFLAVIILCVLPTAAWAAPIADPDARREQMRLEAQASYEPLGQMLKAILEKATYNQRPSPQQTEDAAALLEANKRNAVLYESPKKAGYMLLQSWVSYNRNKAVNTLNWAVRACKEDPTNGDAWVSQTLFSLLYGQKPVDPQALVRKPQTQTDPQRQRPQRPQRPGRTAEEVPMETAVTYNEATPYGQPGVLTFDVGSLNREFLRERFAAMELKTVDNQQFSYSPAADILCLLIWRDEETSDPNTPGATPARNESAMDNPMGMMEGMGQVGATGHSLDDQQAYFEVMIEALAAKKEVKFLEVNTNSPAGYKQAVAHHRPVCSLVAAGDPQSGAAPFLRLNVKSPFMAIIDKEGKVKYAGPADGFVPAFILTHITGVAIDLESFQPAQQTAIPMQMEMMPGEMSGMMMPDMYDPNKMPSPADPNKKPTLADPNRFHPQSPIAPQSVMPAEKQYRQLPLEEQMAAEKKITFIRDLYIKGSRSKIQSYKRGVDMCREVLRDYPNTIYADQARQELRKVPENKRATYNITDAELGL